MSVIGFEMNAVKVYKEVFFHVQNSGQKVESRTESMYCSAVDSVSFKPSYLRENALHHNQAKRVAEAYLH